MNHSQLIPVNFHGDELYLIDHNDEPYTPMKPIVAGMGLAWPPQFTKLTENKTRWGVTEFVTPSEGGPQETLCMPVRKLPAYLLSIYPNKCAPHLRESIIRYQNECDDVLWRYWTGQEVRNPRSHGFGERSHAQSTKWASTVFYAKRRVFRAAGARPFEAAELAARETLEETGVDFSSVLEVLPPDPERKATAEASPEDQAGVRRYVGQRLREAGASVGFRYEAPSTGETFVLLNKQQLAEICSPYTVLEAAQALDAGDCLWRESRTHYTRKMPRGKAGEYGHRERVYWIRAGLAEEAQP